ncbi:hypothetical protein ES702_04582 [subsurface metagenome]
MHGVLKGTSFDSGIRGANSEIVVAWRSDATVFRIKEEAGGTKHRQLKVYVSLVQASSLRRKFEVCRCDHS